MQNLPLRDIHWPEPLRDWPPAPGWWAVLLLLLLAAAGSVLWWRRRNRSIIRQALAELQNLEQDPLLSPVARCRRLSCLLRQVCLSLYPRETVAGLTGPSWLGFLDQALDQPRFSQGIGHHLIETLYQPEACPSPDELQALFALTRVWLKASCKRRLFSPDGQTKSTYPG